MKNTTRLATSIAALSFCAFAGAETDTAPVISFQMTVGGATSSWQDGVGTNTGDNTLWHYEGSHFSNGGKLQYTLFADPDPILGFDFTVTNDTDETQEFKLFTSMFVPTWKLGSAIGASVGASVTDSNNSGFASLTSVDLAPIFEGQIDGNNWLPLFAATDVSVEAPGETSVLSDIDGLPGPSNPGPNVVFSEVAISLKFELSGGDSASFSGVFIVEYVPSPTGALAFIGLAMLGRRRRD